MKWVEKIKPQPPETTLVAEAGFWCMQNQGNEDNRDNANGTENTKAMM